MFYRAVRFIKRLDSQYTCFSYVHYFIFALFFVGNGEIDFEEFVMMMAKKNQDADTEKELKEAFSVFDQDCDGFINTKELKQVMSNLGENLTDDDVEAMIREADKDGDGKISFKGISDCFSNAELSSRIPYLP